MSVHFCLYSKLRRRNGYISVHKRSLRSVILDRTDGSALHLKVELKPFFCTHTAFVSLHNIEIKPPDYLYDDFMNSFCHLKVLVPWAVNRGSEIARVSLKTSPFVFRRRRKVLRVWNDTMMRNR